MAWSSKRSGAKWEEEHSDRTGQIQGKGPEQGRGTALRRDEGGAKLGGAQERGRG